MKTFKDEDIRMEEEIIERSINEGGQALEQSFNQINDQLRQNCDILKKLSQMKDATTRNEFFNDNFLDEDFMDQVKTFIPHGN